MKILFCKIIPMKYYKGISEDDRPDNSYVPEPQSKNTGEQYNFKPVIEKDGRICCHGYFENHGRKVILENFDKSADSKSIENVLVIWCAKYNDFGNVIVGWYKNATVYRCLQKNPDWHYTIADIENCVLLPEKIRKTKEWKLPDCIKLQQNPYKYANTPEIQKYAKIISRQIDNYEVNNWILKYKD